MVIEFSAQPIDFASIL